MTSQHHADDPIERLHDDVDEISALMDHMMECRHADTVAVDPLRTIHHLESLEPQKRAMLFQNDG